MGGAASARAFSNASRRSRNGFSTKFSWPSASRSKATKLAGVSRLSLAIREAAGWMRCWRVSKFSRSPVSGSIMTISPSMTEWSGKFATIASTSSGK